MSLRPYFEHGGITLFCADCREVLPSLAFACVVTDPPYGLEIGHANNPDRSGGYGGHLGKRAYLGYEDTYENFIEKIVPALNASIQRATRAAVFTGPHIHEQAKPDAIGGIYSPAATGRTAWGSKNFLPVLFYGQPPLPGRHRPTVIRSTIAAEPNGHPCPKPLAWMLWLVDFASQAGECVLDPFAGSGTTLVAAKQLGRRAIGIEIEERYAEIAAHRLAQEVLPLESAA